MDSHAIIDLGTNTFHLLIADNNRNIIHEEKSPVKLGAGGINNGLITTEGMARALNCLIGFKATCDKFSVKEILAIGTSALRNAKNSAELLNAVKQKTGIIIKIISGDEEARFIYQGVKTAVKLGHEKNLIVDIGGGSVEFIIGNEEQIFWKKSIEVGGQRLYERFHKHEPISKEELNALADHITEALSPLNLPLQEHNPKTLVGSSGTFETLSDMFCARENIMNKQLPESPLSIKRFQEIHKDLLIRNKEERVALPGMMEWRAEMIVCTTILIDILLKMHSFTAIKVSRYSLKEGVLFNN